jgi:hypothetical protein
MTLRTAASLLLVVESVGVLAWWTTIAASSAVLHSFTAPDAPASTLVAFLPADLVFTLTGLLAARALRRGSPTVGPDPWLVAHAGMAVYAGLYAWALPIIAGGPWLGAFLMLPVLALSPTIVLLTRRPEHAA